MNRFAKDLLAGKWVEILRTGKYNRTTFTEQDLNDIADNYDTNFRTAPLVIGHPSLLEVEGEREAQGEIYSLRVVNGSLQARFKNLSEKVKEGLQSGKWINRSIEAMKFSGDSGSDKHWYLTALALLGGSQPAVPAMFEADGDKITINCINDNPNQPPKHEGASEMDEAQVNALIVAATKPLQDEIAELRGRTNVSLEDFQKMQEKVAEVDQLKASNDKLVADLAAGRNDTAQKECDTLFAGPTKALFDDKYKASCLAALSSGNRELFDVFAAPVLKAKGKFSYLFEEKVGEDTAEGPDSETTNLKFAKGKDQLETKRSKRMMEIIAKAKKDGVKLSADDALIQAYQEVNE